MSNPNPVRTAQTGAKNRFKKGKSGNPGGRPRVIGIVRDLAREQTESAINALVEICGDKESPPSARVAAAQALLDRGYGKPTQYIEESANPIDAMSEDDQRALYDALEAFTGSTGDATAGTEKTH